jgi:type III secretory pathway component EscR
MDSNTKYLKDYLVIFGILNNFVISFTIPLLLGDWLLWQPRNVAIEMMVSSIYLAMGIVMIRIARNPLPHKAFIDFLVIANLAHALVMLIFAEHIWHIIIDVGAIALMGALPLFFYPWGLRKFLQY